MRDIEVGLLVEDFDIYPRDRVSQTNVKALAEAMENGYELPPIIADQKSKRVIDGFHRRRAYLRLFGEEHKVKVALRRYKNDQEMLIDASRYNSHHGLRLDTHDKITALLKGEKLGADIQLMAAALCIAKAKVEDLINARTAKENGDVKPIKATIKHMHGQVMTRRQWEANKKLSGMKPIFYINQLIELLESDLLDESDQGVLERLGVLHELLSQRVAHAG